MLSTRRMSSTRRILALERSRYFSVIVKRALPRHKTLFAKPITAPRRCLAASLRKHGTSGAVNKENTAREPSSEEQNKEESKHAIVI